MLLGNTFHMSIFMYYTAAFGN